MFDRKLFTTLAREGDADPNTRAVFPLPILDGGAPVLLVFDPQDVGVEIAYERHPARRCEKACVRLASRETSLYWMPRFVPVFAVADGKIVYARKHLDGHVILVEHLGGWMTFYGRLEHMFATPSDRRPQREAKVNAGDILGYATASEATALRPLRFELWRGHREQDYDTIDPLRFIHRWRLPRWTEAGLEKPPPARAVVT